MGQDRKFDDMSLIEAWNKNSGNEAQTAKDLGVSRNAVRKRRKALGEFAMVSAEQWNTKKVDTFRDLQRRLVTSITHGDIMKSSAAQRVTMAAILEDKIRLMEGQATAHIEHQHFVGMDDETRALLADFDKQYTAKKLQEITYDE
jgi:hypothetical protein